MLYSEIIRDINYDKELIKSRIEAISMNNKVWKVIFSIYILLVLNFIVIKFNGKIQYVINTIQLNMIRRNRGESFVNLVPFRTIGTYIGDLSFGIAFMNILGNIIPFIPMGFLIPMVFPSQRNIIKTMISCFIFILSIEILQLCLVQNKKGATCKLKFLQ